MLSFLSRVVPRPHPLVAALRTLPPLARSAVRKRPRTTAVVLALLVVAGTAGGLYLYLLHQWDAAQAAVKASRLDEAQERLKLCLFVWPRSIPVHLLAARAARLKGDFEGAEAHLNRCLKLVDAQRPVRRPLEGTEDYRNRCLKLQHDTTEAIQLEFLLMRVQGGEEDEVRDELLLYVEKGSPESAMILETLARAYMHNVRYGYAFDALGRWIKAAPDSAEPLRWRAWVLEQLNDREGAMNDYKRALELDPDLVPVRLRLAEMYLRSNPPAALPHLERLSQQFPDRPDIMARLGQARFAQGEAEEARRLLEAAVEKLPDDSDLLITLAKLEMQEHHFARAEEWVRRALKVDPTDVEAEFTLAAALEAQDRWSEAQAVREQHRKDTALLKRVTLALQKEAEHPSSDPDALSDLGALYLKNNERVGLYWLHQALRRDPGHQPSHQLLAEYYESKGEWEKAADHRRQLKSDRKTPSR